MPQVRFSARDGGVLLSGLWMEFEGVGCADLDHLGCDNGVSFKLSRRVLDCFSS